MYAARLLTVALILPLTGCLGMSEAEIAAKKAESASQDDQTCKSYGAKPGSDAYISCRVAQTQRRDAADAAAAAMPTTVIVNNPAAPSYPTLQPVIYPGPRCTSRGC
jgi:hypothetical protein